MNRSDATLVDSGKATGGRGVAVGGAGRAPQLHCREDFPALAYPINGKRLVYLDTAASALKPQSVIDSLSQFYARDYANIHRGAHSLSVRATEAYEQARIRVQSFISARDAREIIFVKGCTEGINLVASCLRAGRVTRGDDVVVTAMEHHSNLLPWQWLCEQTGASLKVVPVNDDGELQLEQLEQLLSPRTKLLAVTHVSNVLGTINPIREISRLAHAVEALVLVEGAQAVVHMPVDVRQLECDFYAFSGHKLYGPSGVGVLWGRYELLEQLPPYQLGGGMVDRVSYAGSTFLDPPNRFEAGTPPIAQAVGLAAAMDYVASLGIDAVEAHDVQLTEQATARLSEIQGLQIVGGGARRTSVVAFHLEGIHCHDLAALLDPQGVAIRVGHHCAQPLVARFGVAALARASFGVYNDLDDVELFVAAVKKAAALCRC